MAGLPHTALYRMFWCFGNGALVKVQRMEISVGNVGRSLMLATNKDVTKLQATKSPVFETGLNVNQQHFSGLIIMQKKDLVNKKAQSRVALRMFYELLLISNAQGRRVGTEEIQAKLSELGLVVCLRTIQRDLNSLRDINAPIKSDGHQPQGWSFFSENLFKEVA